MGFPKFEKNRPLIGLTGPSSFTNDCLNMIEVFFEANPIMLYHQNQNNLLDWLQICDAVILAGGVDIHPRTYGEDIPVDKGMRNFDYRRDVREKFVIDFCISNNVPMLGICRGHQLLGVDRLKLELEPDLCQESLVFHSASKQDNKLEIDIHTSLHSVDIIDGSNYPGESKLFVNSFHHQGLLHYAKDKNKLNNLDAVGTSVYNGKKSIIELMINHKENWASCQWHPEWDWTVQSSSRNFLAYFRRHFLEKVPIAEQVAVA